jgi:MFS family permease
LGYQVVYLVCAASGVLTLLLALRLPVPPETTPAGQSWRETLRIFKTVAANQTILFTCLVEAAILFAYGTFESFLPLYAVGHGLSTTQVGVFLSGQIIVLALTKPILGKFSDRHGRRPQIVVGGMLGALCIGGFAVFSLFIPLLLLSLGFGLCLAIVTSATAALIADLSSQEARGSAMGLLGSIMDIGHSSGPLCAGLIATSFGYGQSFLGAASVLLGVTLFFLISKVKSSGQK